MMRGTIRVCLCLIVVGMCFLTACGQTTHGKLIDEINVTLVRVRKLTVDAERKRKEAGEKSASGDQAEHDKLIEEAAKIFGQASDALTEAANKSDEVAKSKTPEWYPEYFGLQAKLIRNFAQMATGAHDELLMRKNGPLSKSQEQEIMDKLKRINKENEELRRQIAVIESREKVVLIKS